MATGAAPLDRHIRRFLLLRFTRWFPTGLLLPVLILLLVGRGLSIGQIGLAAAAQGLMVFLLELPTGGLADAIGRRPVLLFASVVEAASLMVLLVADSVAVLLIVFAFQGVYRALESGPLDAWFVDEAHRLDPEADIERALGLGGAALGVAIAGGALVAAALVAVAPVGGVDPLAVPVAVAVGLRLVDLTAIAVAMREVDVRRGFDGVRASVARTSTIVGDTVRVISRSRVLGFLIAVEFVWAFGMTAFETLVPAKLADVVSTTESAAALFGPSVSVAWLVSAGAAAVAPALSSRLGPVPTAMALHLTLALLTLAMAVAAGPVGVLIFYVLTLGAHGAVDPIYLGLLHSQADAERRTTVLSAASMVGHPGAAIGGASLGALADRTSVTTAMVGGACFLAVAVPLYIPAHRDSRRAAPRAL